MRFAIGFLLLLTGCAGYQIGNGSLFTDKVGSVYVPTFESNSFRRGLSEMLTEAVVKEIERRTPYKVVGNPSADTVLTGRITGDTKHVLLEERTGDPRAVEMGLTVQVSWRDQSGNVIRDGKPIPIPGDLANVSATNNLVTEAGQSTATTEMAIVKKLAHQIVDLMEKPW